MSAAPALVLTYHRVVSGPDPLLQCVTPEHFAEHLDALREAVAVVPLRALDEPSDHRRLAITFDDGYADNAEAAAPMLRDREMPATFFVTSRILDDPRETWWDRVEHLLEKPGPVAELDIAPGGRRVRIDVRTDEGRQRALKVVNRRLRERPLAEIEPVVDDIARQLGADAEPRCAHHALMDATQVAALASGRLEVGSHGVTHTMLGALDDAGQHHEVEQSKRRLEAAVGGPVTSFAYPYGTPGSFTRTTVSLLRAAGYQRACVNTVGAVRKRTGRYEWPRCMVYDWTGDELFAHVEEWFARW